MDFHIGTESKYKISAVQEVINLFKSQKLLTSVAIIPHSINSSLSVTPRGSETYTCAKERAAEIYKRFGGANSGASLYVGIENGLVKRYNRVYEECWCAILDEKKEWYFGYSSGLALPENILKKMKAGELHHKVMTSIAGDEVKSRQTWGIYTNNSILRERSIEEAFRNALYYALTSKT